MNNFGKRIKAILKDIDKIELQPINTTFLQESIPKGDIYIECTDNIHNLRIRLSGNGTITIRDGSTIELTDKIKQIEVHPRYVSDEGISVVEIFGVENIHTLEITHDADDLLANSIRKLEFNNITNNINKLVLNNNLITELDLTLCEELQFLHMFNNPICDDDTYSDNFNHMIETLPDRSNRAMGSIVFYPWYGLETLIEQDSEGNYHKYPYIPNEVTNFNNPINPYYKYFYENDVYKFDANKLYRLVKNDDDFIYNVVECGDICNYENYTGNKFYLTLDNLTVGKVYSFNITPNYNVEFENGTGTGNSYIIFKLYEKHKDSTTGTLIKEFMNGRKFNNISTNFVVREDYEYYTYVFFGNIKGTFKENSKVFSFVDNIKICETKKVSYSLDKYYQYNEGNLELPEDITDSKYRLINKHTEKRLTIEPELLNKYWLVGSAILYDEEASKRCPWDFRQLHTADVWETAEKGFGVTLGSVDRFTLLTPEVEHYNIRSYTPIAGRRYPEYTKEQVRNNESFHGDSCYSIVIGCGVDKKNLDIGNKEFIEWLTSTRFGIIPLCDCVFIDRGDLFTELPRMCDENIVDGISTSLSYNGYINDTVGSTVQRVNDLMVENESLRRRINNFASKKPLTNSAANGGINRPYLHTFEDMSNGCHYASATIWGNDDTNHFMGYYVPSLNKDNYVSPFSVPSQGVTTTPFVTDDYIASYGASITKCSIKNFGEVPQGCLVTSNGTSYSSPLLMGQLLLLMNIYRKLPDSDTSSFGKDSEFMRFVKSHWLRRLPQNMDFAQGIGMIDPLADPIKEIKLLRNESSLPNEVFCNLGEYLDLNYADSGKGTFTPEYQFDKIAITRDGHLYSLYEGVIENLPIYSNTSRNSSRLSDGTNTYYDKNHFRRNITINTSHSSVYPNSSTLPISNITLEDKDVFSLNIDRTTDFTVSLCVKLDDSSNEFVKSVPSNASMYIPVAYFKDANDNINKLQLTGTKKGDKVDFHRSGLLVQSNDKGKNNYKITQFDLAYITTGDSYDSNGDLAKNSIIIGDNFGNMVITFVKQGSELLVYYNGTYRGIMSFDNDYIKEFYIAKEFLCDDSEDCIFAYNQVLTDDEIVKNSIAILNNHFQD